MFNFLKCFIIFLSCFFIFKLSAHHLKPFQYPGISGKWGYKDSRSNQVIIYWHFDEADSFGIDGLARVKVDNKYGMIDTSGLIVVPIQYPNLPRSFVNDTLYCSVYTQRKFYIREQGIISKHNEDFRIEEKEPSYYQLTRLKVFQYPKDSAIYSLLYTSQMNDRWPTYHFNVIEDDPYLTIENGVKLSRRKYFSAIAGFGISTAYVPLMQETDPKSTYSFSYVDLNYSKYFHNDNNRRSLFGLGTAYRRTVHFGDSFSYRNKQLSLEFLNRFYLTKGLYMHMTLSPIVNSDSKFKSRIPNSNQSWRDFPLQNSKISAGFSFGFGFNATNHLEFLINYQYVPNPYLNNRIKSNFLEFGAFVNLE